jgi:ubiquinone/menaquinone biosynthesis C-methylase UbiE
MNNIVSVYGNNYYRDNFINYILKNRHMADKRVAKHMVDDFLESEVTMKTPDHLLAPKLADLLNFVYPRLDIKNRAFERGNIVTEILHKFNIKPKALLDIGAGDGSITAEVAKKFSIPKKYTIGVELEKIKNDKIKSILPSDVKNLPSGKFELIMSFMSLHHISDLDSILNEITRLITTGGVFVIREHDCSMETNPLLVKYLHSLHAIIYAEEAHKGVDTPENYDKLYSAIKYRSKSDWVKLITDKGFTSVYEHTYPGNNPQRIFHMAFRKNKN